MTNQLNDGHIGCCPICGKRQFVTRSAARKKARTLRGRGRLTAYKCGDTWHVGHLPRAVVNGNLDRSLISPRRPRG